MEKPIIDTSLHILDYYGPLVFLVFALTVLSVFFIKFFIAQVKKTEKNNEKHSAIIQENTMKFNQTVNKFIESDLKNTTAIESLEKTLDKLITSKISK